MKTMITAIAISMTLLTTSVQADSRKEELCEAISSFANTVMASRQDGVSIQRMLATVNGSDTIHRLMKKIIVNAYESPAYSTSSVKQKSITEFENKWTVYCIKHVHVED